jgi:hypothetical protein
MICLNVRRPPKLYVLDPFAFTVVDAQSGIPAADDRCAKIMGRAVRRDGGHASAPEVGCLPLPRQPLSFRPFIKESYT